MSKVAIMTDSNSGITQDAAKELGVHVIPMPFMMGEKTYFEDITLSQEQFYEKLNGGEDISTSQPSPTDVTDMWDELLKTYDEIVFIPMSSGLSGTCQTAMMLSDDDPYEGKVFVVDNQRISVTQKQSVLDAKRLAEEGKTGSEIAKILFDCKFESSIYIMLDTLYYLKKGGRITPAAAALGTLLKLKPVLTIQGEKLDAFAKARTISQGKTMMIHAIRKDIETRFGGDNANVEFAIAYTEDTEAANKWREEVMAAFPGCEVMMDSLSLSIACHIGPGALALAVSKKI